MRSKWYGVHLVMQSALYMWHHEKTTFKMDKTNTFVPRTFCFSNIVLRIPILPCLGSFWCVKIEKYELWLIEIEKRIFFL